MFILSRNILLCFSENKTEKGGKEARMEWKETEEKCKRRCKRKRTKRY